MRYDLLALCAAAVLASLGSAAPAHAQGVDYRITKTVALGEPDGWDYLYFEPTTHRVFVAHSTEITVVDGHSGEILGRVQGITGVNGITAIPELGKGYTDSRAKRAAVAFDLRSFKPSQEIPADTDTDALLYDPSTRRVFVMDGDPMNATVIDATNDKVVATVALEGKPEFTVSDNAGHVYINLTDKKEIVRVDAKRAKVDARWSIPACEAPHGLAMDRKTHRLFSSCVNSKLVVVNADDGHTVAELPIGRGTDAAAFDPTRHLVFSSNGEGTLSVIREETPDRFVAVATIKTKPFARTMTLDPASGRLYLVTADLDEVNPQATSLRQRYAIRRGTVQLLFMDPS